jgi:ribosomal protein S12 methylthiotransferase
MRLQKQVVRRAHRRRLGQQVTVLVDGPTAEHDLVLRGRLEGQAPEIDPLVYLTDCDPSALSPGQFIHAEIVASRGYDLVVRPGSAESIGEARQSAAATKSARRLPLSGAEPT